MRCGLAVVTVLAACGARPTDRAMQPNVATIAAPTRADPHVPAGCITDVSAGDHAYTCDGLKVDARIPPQCAAPGCGLILVLHGDAGTGLLMDANLQMRELGQRHGYIVIAPTGPRWRIRSTWRESDDATLVDIVTRFKTVFRVDPKKVHVTGFSHGGFVTWRLLCDHADLFASAAPAAAGRGRRESTCFFDGRHPARKVPIVFLIGRRDVAVSYSSMTAIRDAAAAAYDATGPTVLAEDASYTHQQWTTSDGATIETWEHAYENDPASPFGYTKGHCVVGTTTDPDYAIACRAPHAFVWGEEVMRFFLAHPMP